MKNEIEQTLREALKPVQQEWAGYKLADGLCVELSKLNLAFMAKNKQEISERLSKAQKAAYKLRKFLNPC